MLLAISLSLLCATAPAHPRLAEALHHYDAQRYQRVVDILEPQSASSAEPERLLLIGKAYGMLAERAPWFRAVVLASRCHAYLERAVAADPDHPGAVRALARFLEEAPVVVGGDAARARQLRQHLQRLERSS